MPSGGERGRTGAHSSSAHVRTTHAIQTHTAMHPPRCIRIPIVWLVWPGFFEKRRKVGCFAQVRWTIA